MKISQRGLDLIKSFEGFRSTAYRCPAGVWTVGYGSTVGVTGGMKVSIVEAEALLRKHLQADEQRLSVAGLRINQQQFDALLCFIYNVGYPSFHLSGLKKAIVINPNDSTIEREFMKWTKAKGVELPGLVARRKKEYQLYSSK